MSAHGIDRRQALRGAGVAAGGLAVGLGLAQPAAASTTSSSKGPAGSYLITRRDDPSTLDPAPSDVGAVVGFAAGNVLTTLDINPPAPVLLGSWERTGNRFEAAVWGGQDAAGPNQPATTVEVRPKGSVSGQSISGTYTFTVRDAASRKVLFTGTGKFHGHKIDA
jgi:hypothetical protein